LPGPNDHAGPESREAYEIRIDSEGAEIRSRSSAGLFYGVQTMRQLVEGDPEDLFLPGVKIHDWPAMAYRGFMMDVSHGPLPTEAEVRRQIDFLARWKANQYYFYSKQAWSDIAPDPVDDFCEYRWVRGRWPQVRRAWNDQQGLDRFQPDTLPNSLAGHGLRVDSRMAVETRRPSSVLCRLCFPDVSPG